VALIPGRVQINEQDLVDQQRERIQLRRPRRSGCRAWLRPSRGQGLVDRASGDAVLALQRPVRHAIAGVAPQRGVQLDLRLARRHRGCSFTEHIQLDTATPMVTSEFANIFLGHHLVPSAFTNN
jgi:hypothetical protein